MNFIFHGEGSLHIYPTSLLSHDPSYNRNPNIFIFIISVLLQEITDRLLFFQKQRTCRSQYLDLLNLDPT